MGLSRQTCCKSDEISSTYQVKEKLIESIEWSPGFHFSTTCTMFNLISPHCSYFFKIESNVDLLS